MKKELLIESWLDPDPDDYITVHDLYTSSLQALDYIEQLERKLRIAQNALELIKYPENPNILIVESALEEIFESE